MQYNPDLKVKRRKTTTFLGLVPLVSFHITRVNKNKKNKIHLCDVQKTPKENPRLGSPDVSYSLRAIKPHKERPSSPSSASSFSHWLSPSGSSLGTERGIIQRLKRLKSNCRLEFLRLPGAPEEGQTFMGKEKRERGGKKINCLPESGGVLSEWWCRALGEFVL